MKHILRLTATRCHSVFNALYRSRITGRLVCASLLTILLWGLSGGLNTPAQAVPYEKNEAGRIQTTERYDKIQSEKGGMNTFDAVDPRRDANADKAQALSDVAKRRKAQADDPLEPAREAIDTLKDRVVDAAEDLVD